MTGRDVVWMRHAIGLALRAREQGEVPVGAVAVRQEQVVGEGWNSPITLNDPTAHAEVLAIRRSAAKLGNYRLPGVTLYVTLEPCAMCVGAIIHARIDRLVFGAHDPKTGAAGSVFDLAQATEHNHSIDLTGGVLHNECASPLLEFFRSRRGK